MNCLPGFLSSDWKGTSVFFFHLLAIAVAADACNERDHAADDNVLRQVRGEDAVKRNEAEHIAILARMIFAAICTSLLWLSSASSVTRLGPDEIPEKIVKFPHSFPANI